ncbi:MAG: MerR family transcriptional regulator [Actinobacteria bacterium]|nr:MerR family transcriptional regulator [Actinomycetota bacterium]
MTDDSLSESQQQAEPPSVPKPPRRTEGRLTIGRLVDSLKDEFPDLTISKVRYLEERGLLSPERTAGGYRTYAQSDARRLRTVLTLQRDEFLPLEVIRRRLARGLPGGSGVAPAISMLQSPERSEALRRTDRVVPWDEALDISGVDDAFMRQLVDYRLIDRTIEPTGDMAMTETDVEIARICGMLSRFGLEPRNLRLTRSAVEREATVIEQVAAPALLSPHAERREQGERLVTDLGALLAGLFQALLNKDMRALFR